MLLWKMHFSFFLGHIGHSFPCLNQRSQQTPQVTCIAYQNTSLMKRGPTEQTRSEYKFTRMQSMTAKLRNQNGHLKLPGFRGDLALSTIQRTTCSINGFHFRVKRGGNRTKWLWIRCGQKINCHLLFIVRRMRRRLHLLHKHKILLNQTRSEAYVDEIAHGLIWNILQRRLQKQMLKGQRGVIVAPNLKT